MSTIRYNPNTPNNVSTSGPKKTQNAQASSVGSTGSTGSCNGGGSTDMYNASYQFGSTGSAGSWDWNTPYGGKLPGVTVEGNKENGTTRVKGDPYIDEKGEHTGSKYEPHNDRYFPGLIL